MEDQFATLGGSRYRLCVPQVDLDEPGFGRAGQVVQAAVGQIVQAEDFVTFGDASLDDLRTDEPGGSGDQDAHPSELTRAG